MKKILVTGDSFAADWSSREIEYPGWVNLLASTHNVTNVAQAGVGEYKILKQLKNSSIQDYDIVIVSHTSHSRIHSNTSLHSTALHSNCDLIFTDVIDSNIKEAEWFFKHVYDDIYYQDIYRLIRTEINKITSSIPTVHIDSFYTNFCNEELDVIETGALWRSNRGKVNHMTEKANKELYDKVILRILSYE